MFIYHATDATITKFNLDYLFYGEHNFGPGIYFSLKDDNIDFYLNENPNGKIYKTAISAQNMVLWHNIHDLTNNKISSFITAYFSSIPLLENHINEIIEKYTGKNYLYVMTNLPYEIHNYNKEAKIDISQDHLKQFLINFVKYTGITSMFVENGTFREEVVVFDAESLDIISS